MAEPSFELTAQYILDIVKVFRTAYVLHVMEHPERTACRRGKIGKPTHLLPLPA